MYTHTHVHIVIKAYHVLKKINKKNLFNSVFSNYVFFESLRHMSLHIIDYSFKEREREPYIKIKKEKIFRFLLLLYLMITMQVVTFAILTRILSHVVPHPKDSTFVEQYYIVRIDRIKRR